MLSIAAQLCDTLTYLHSQTPPILHRDIKPVNIRFTSQGIVKLVDFGLVMRGGAITRSTRRTSAAAYAPLEQWGGGANVRRDIYSLAATLYHLFTGNAPLTATERSTNTTLYWSYRNDYEPRVQPQTKYSALQF